MKIVSHASSRWRGAVFIQVLMILAVVVLGASTIKPLYASPAEIHVYPGDSIQAAINAAGTGDSIVVHEGTYSENVDVNKTVNLLAEGAVTVNWADPNDHVFNVTANYVNMTGFTVIGATVFPWAGICLYNVNNCNISNNNALNNSYGICLSSTNNNILINNSAYNNINHGIYLAYSDNNVLTDNNASSNFMGIHLDHSNNNILASNNASSNYYGISLYYYSNNNTLTNNNAYNNHYGITLYFFSNNNTLTNNNAYNNYGCGIFLYYHSSNNTIINNNAYNNGIGIHLYLYNTNNTLTYNHVYDNSYDGIHLFSSNNNTLTNNNAYNTYVGIHFSYSNNNTLTNNNADGNEIYGIYLDNSNNNTFTNSTVYNNEYGIFLTGSNSNKFNVTYASNALWDFYSDPNSHWNVVLNLNLSSYPTTISFTYDNGIRLKGVTTAPSDPPGMLNIGQYVEILNEAINSWIYLNVSYTDAEILYVYEESLRLYRWDGEEWLLADGSGVNGVNTAENYVYANITEFSIFASLGNPIPEYKVTINTSGLTSPSYTTHIYVDGEDQGPPYLWDGQSREFVFPVGETRTIRVDQYVLDGEGTRYYCESYSWTTATSGDQTHTFTYVTQYRLTAATEPPSLEPRPTVTPPDLWYDKGTKVACTAQDVFGYSFKYWSVDNVNQGSDVNPITVTMDAPHTAIAHYEARPPVGGVIKPINKVAVLSALIYGNITSIAVAAIALAAAIAVLALRRSKK